MDNSVDDLHLIEAAARPAFVLARDYADGDTVPLHAHSVGQLLHTLCGVVHARTPGRAWALPPHRALWIPHGVPHAFAMAGSASVRTLYIVPERAQLMPAEPMIIAITPLIRELILRAVACLDAPPGDPVEPLVVDLLLAELAAARREPLWLAWPQSRELRAFARMVREQPADRSSLEDAAHRVGLSAKTLSRRFVRETGLTPDAWRRQARLLAAVTRLELGESVTRVALDLGFRSPSSFSAAFRQAFGVTPRQARARARV